MRLFFRSLLCFWFMFLLLSHGHAMDDVSKEAKKRLYVIYPDFITNLSSSEIPHYLRVRVSVLTVSEQAPAVIEYHEPLLKDRLLNIFNAVPRQKLMTSKGRKELQEDVQRMVSETLAKENHSKLVERVILTRWLIE